MTRTPPDDERDASLIRKMIMLLVDRDDLNRTKIIRDDIDYIWTKPRETPQGYRKRASGAWWSPAALDLKDQQQTTDNDGNVVGTIGEHVVPMRLVAKYLLELERTGPLPDTDHLLRVLRLPMAIVTVCEDALLPRQDMPDGWSFAAAEANWDVQIWARYASAKLPVAKVPAVRRRRPAAARVQRLIYLRSNAWQVSPPTSLTGTSGRQAALQCI